MNVKRFRTVSKISAYVLRGFAILLVLFFTLTLFQVLSGNSNVWFNYDGPSFAIFTTEAASDVPIISEADFRLAALFMVPLLAITSVYIYWKGGSLFKSLADGESPFTAKFAKSLQRLSIVMILTDIAFPIIHSIILSTIYSDGYRFTLGLSAPFVIGVILYAVSEIFFYGIELQTLSDETV